MHEVSAAPSPFAQALSTIRDRLFLSCFLLSALREESKVDWIPVLVEAGSFLARRIPFRPEQLLVVLSLLPPLPPRR